jgi:hypothetical protein
MSFMKPPVTPRTSDHHRARRDVERPVGEVAEPFVGLVLQADGEQQRRAAQDHVDQRLRQALGADDDGAGTVGAVEQTAPPQQHLAALPQAEGQHADTDDPQQHPAAGPVGDRPHRAGLVGVGPAQPPGEPHGQPADEQVHGAVGDQPGARQVG